MNNGLYILFFALLLSTSTSYSQNTNYSNTNYSIDDGLPSNECYRILQDTSGYIWIATDRGLSRFDGYEFKNYGVQSGLTDLSCIQMDINSKSDIYIGTYGSGLFKYIKHLDSIVPIPIQLEKDQNINTILDLQVEKNDTCLLLNKSGTFVKLSIDGKQSKAENKFTHHAFFTKIVGSNILTGYSSNKEAINSKYSIVHKGKTIETVQDSDNRSKPFAKSYILNDSIEVLSINGTTYILIDDSLSLKREEPLITEMLIKDNGVIYTSQIYNGGLKVFKNTKAYLNNEFEHILKATSCTDFLLDKDNNLWLSTLEGGLYYFKKTHVSLFPIPKQSTKNIGSMSINSKNEIYYVSNKKDLWKYDINKNRTIQLLKTDFPINDLYSINEGNNSLFIAGEPSFFLDKKNRQIPFSDYSSSGNSLLNAKKIISSNQLTYIIHPRYFHIYDKQIKKQKLLIKKALNSSLLFGLDFNNADDWYAVTNKGLQHYNGKKLSFVDSTNPLLSCRINSIDSYNSNYILGTLGYGIVIWNTIHGVVKHITTQDNLISNNIENVYIDDNKHIYAMTKAGLSIITLKNNLEYTINNLTIKNGLPTNSIVDVLQTSKKEIIIATESGIVKYDGAKTIQEVVTPMILNIFVNGIQTQQKELAYNKNNILIKYISIDHTQQGNIKYRHRLNSKKWTPTLATNISYSSLLPSHYTFEVQAQSINGKWSPSKSYQFIIHPPWWRTYSFYGFLIIFFSLGSYLIYNWRLKTLLKESKIKVEITNLEKAALQAQMNPHFIFNCLSSIQNFIITNDTENAMNYLSSFAELIRQNLQASVSNTITLEEEVQMLQNYMDLEKMRFNNGFEYNLEIGPNINSFDINISPLLIQPFVENAIIHGLSSIKGKGKIDIKFIKKSNSLFVSIQDNGTGIKKKISETRKSFGMSITRKRLALINKGLDENYKIDVKSDQNGTLVNIKIDLD